MRAILLNAPRLRCYGLGWLRHTEKGLPMRAVKVTLYGRSTRQAVCCQSIRSILNYRFLFLGGAHLDRWRGHALACLGDPKGVAVLADALRRLDPSFARAETSLRIDLVMALVTIGELKVVP